MKNKFKKITVYGKIAFLVYLLIQAAIFVSFPFRYSTLKTYFLIAGCTMVLISFICFIYYKKTKNILYVLVIFFSLLLAVYWFYQSSILPKKEILYQEENLEYFAYPVEPSGWKKRSFYVYFHLRDPSNEKFMYEKVSFIKTYEYKYFETIEDNLDKHYDEFYLGNDSSAAIVEIEQEDTLENDQMEDKVLSYKELDPDSDKIIAQSNKYYYLKTVDAAMQSVLVEVFESADQSQWTSLGELPFYDEIYHVAQGEEYIFLAYPPVNHDVRIIITKDFKEFTEIDLFPVDKDNLFLEKVTMINNDYVISLSSPRWVEQTSRSHYQSKDGITWEYVEQEAISE